MLEPHHNSFHVLHLNLSHRLIENDELSRFFRVRVGVQSIGPTSEYTVQSFTYEDNRLAVIIVWSEKMSTLCAMGFVVVVCGPGVL